MKTNVEQRHIHRTEKSGLHPFTQTSNKVYDDKSISFNAKVLLLLILREIDFYQFHLEYFAKKHSLGLRPARAAINELIEKGYCHKIKHTKRRVEYHFYELPELNPNFRVVQNALLIIPPDNLSSAKRTTETCKMKHSVVQNELLSSAKRSTNNTLYNTNYNTLSKYSSIEEEKKSELEIEDKNNITNKKISKMKLMNRNEEEYNVDELNGFGLEEDQSTNEKAKRPKEEENNQPLAEDNRTIENIMVGSGKYDLLKVEYEERLTERRLDFTKLFNSFLKSMSDKKDKDRKESSIFNRFTKYMDTAVERTPVKQTKSGAPIQQDNKLTANRTGEEDSLPVYQHLSPSQLKEIEREEMREKDFQRFVYASLSDENKIDFNYVDNYKELKSGISTLLVEHIRYDIEIGLQEFIKEVKSKAGKTYFDTTAELITSLTKHIPAQIPF